LITIREITADGLTFTCREAGTSGEPVILLHGFPETSHMWTKLMPQFVEAGYRCLAPGQRGYSPGARPDGIEQYRYEDISDDVIALADAWGASRFHLVGHD
jgi:pimeloyl-ACP methyl ester carboxylesterase